MIFLHTEDAAMWAPVIVAAGSVMFALGYEAATRRRVTRDEARRSK